MINYLYKDDEMSVYDEDCIRHMMIGSQCQGRYSVETREPVSKYALEVIAYIEKNIQYRDILVIGGGPFLVPTALTRTGHQVDVIEPNTKVLKLAGMYFSPQCASVYQSFAQDIIDTVGVYDAVVVDAYNGSDPVPELYNETFYAKCFDHINVGGTLITNDIRHGFSKVQFYEKQ